MPSDILEIKNLSVSIDKKEIIKDVSMTVRSGEIHALMGPNGTGKSTLAQTVIGNPKYKINSGSITLNGKDLTNLQIYERAREGIFVAFQEPVAVQGLRFINYLRTAYTSLHPDEKLEYKKFLDEVKELLSYFGLDNAFLDRGLNDGLSGGEKKRMEALQMLILKPKIIILDEIDSGLDVDALRIVSKAIGKARDRGAGIIIITHYQRILEHIKPDFVHVLINGRIAESGKGELARVIEERGYDYYKGGEIDAKIG
ncbi:MAG: Fe-S cluster assembly ATPase SufC [Thermoplasmatales archaeon]